MDPIVKCPRDPITLWQYDWGFQSHPRNKPCYWPSNAILRTWFVSLGIIRSKIKNTNWISDWNPKKYGSNYFNQSYPFNPMLPQYSRSCFFRCASLGSSSASLSASPSDWAFMTEVLWPKQNGEFLELSGDFSCDLIGFSMFSSLSCFLSLGERLGYSLS